MMEIKQQSLTIKPWRQRFILCLLLTAMSSLVVRAAWLQYQPQPRLQSKLNIQHLEVVKDTVARGRILDRRGDVLAMSAPVFSVGIDAKLFSTDAFQVDALAVALEVPVAAIQAALTAHPGSRYVLIKRRLSPALAKRVSRLGYLGVVVKEYYERYYPAAEASGHLVGFAGNQQQGLEGAELIYDAVLKGDAGSHALLRDRKRHFLEQVQVSAPQQGDDVRLSIDQRLQYAAYHALKSAVAKHQAEAAALVMLDANSGEILALVNLPEFNPNSRADRQPKLYRNRAVTDVFEPGSTIKPFTIACGLEVGVIDNETLIDTKPGYFKVGRNRVRDTHDYGLLDVQGVIRKSSNVGTTKIALELEAEELWDCFDRAGFGRTTEITIPGQVAGYLPEYQGWGQFEQATHSFGYGLNTSLIKLAQSYAVWANEGAMPPLNLLADQAQNEVTQVFSADVADQVLQMMESVVSNDGTARRAQIKGYRVAGKTGTVKKITDGGYSKDHHLGLFVGIAPVSDPRFILAVVVDDPAQGGYYGGVVAAPVFAKVMSKALRLYSIPPDKPEDSVLRVAHTALLPN